MGFGDCKWCGNVLSDHEMFHGETCDVCLDDQEREQNEAHEAEYDDARWNLAHEYGYDAP